MRQEKLWVIVEVLASPAQHFPPYSRGQGKPRREGIKQSSSTTQMCLFFFFFQISLLLWGGKQKRE